MGAQEALVTLGRIDAREGDAGAAARRLQASSGRRSILWVIFVPALDMPGLAA